MMEPLVIEGLSAHEELRVSEKDGHVRIEVDESYSTTPGYARVDLTPEKAQRLIQWLGRFVAGPEGM